MKGTIAMTIAAVKKQMEEVRECFDDIFSADTAYDSKNYKGGSHGHCAVVAAILKKKFGGDMYSTTINGQSHWFNQIIVDEIAYDVDITGDQFGLPAVQVGEPYTLYQDNRLRHEEQFDMDTVWRVMMLRKKYDENCRSI